MFPLIVKSFSTSLENLKPLFSKDGLKALKDANANLLSEEDLAEL